MLIPTFRAHLARVARVNPLNGYPVGLPFIADEAIELGKRPTVQLAFRFAFADLGRLPNVGQVFQDNRTANGGGVHDLFAEGMIAISVETRLTLAQSLEVTFGGFTSVRLLSSESIHFVLLTHINFRCLPGSALEACL